MKNWNVRKAIVAREEMPEHHRLAQTLSWPHLVALGVGAIVGTGILTLIGVGAGKAGPAVILSFAIAGIICACASLAYAEVATMIPASGSAYTYSYTVFGELIAWMVGVALILEALPWIVAPSRRAEAYIDLCHGYMELEDLQQAVKYGQMGLELAAEDRQVRNAHYLLGEVACKMDDLTTADFHFGELARFYPAFRNLKSLLFAIDLRGMVNFKL